ncbi:penicillin-binding protein [Streptomyces spiroverticillatus]|uniref:Penicillin-binding protein n=1 Tax=Streptomyces finlayi TaxID=67296 RepID=A0A919CC53_9ACTN|nr:penicillin-binding transpeptidase domain-containing protein [Streptomyces finlayi]GHA19351.1 penicillin-binding protein [Streptomyces spiroverticillatus]GHD02343.1 penicillin-binding protein [Streptomyces finlayi]
MRSGAKVAVVGGAFVLVAGGVGYGGYNLYTGMTGGSGSGSSGQSNISTQNEPAKTGPPSQDEIRTASQAFFAAWSKGEPETAAQLTNNAVEATTVLAAFADEAHISGLKITPGTATGAKVPFTVTGKVGTEDAAAKPLSYQSALTVVRGKTTGKALVDWQPTVIHPELKKGETLKTGTASAPPIKAVDRNGKELTKEDYPSLGPVLEQLRKKYGEQSHGKPGVELYIEPAQPEQPARTLLTLSKGEPGKLQTTIDAGVQAVAEKAVKRFKGSSVVALNRQTGAIRAIADNHDSGFGVSVGGTTPPGSTLKIMTAAMLLEKGIVSPGSTVECPADVTYEGRTINNLNHKGYGNIPFSRAFAVSCNSAFIKQIVKVKDDGALPAFAASHFGIGTEWKTGIATFDGRIPPGQGGEAASQYIGQGQTQFNPLNIASITATATTGRFRQPYVVPAELDDRPFAKASPLSPATVQGIRSMMRLTATSGTAAKAMGSVGGDKGAKTGSAELDGQKTSDSWFTGYAGDLTAAAMVLKGGHGGDAAGPIVANVLNAR